MRIIIFGVFLTLPLFTHSYLFINSTPLKAEVYILEQESWNKGTDKFNKKFLGKTPLKIDMPTTDIKILVQNNGFEDVTNDISISKKAKSVDIVMTPRTFAVQFPSVDSNFYVNKIPVDSINGTVLFPYGNYFIRYNKQINAIDINYQSPYVPYVAFFSVLTALSIGATISGAILGDRAYKDFNKATDPQDIISTLNRTVMWDSIMWTGVGVGVAGLIGTAITADLEAKERKRIKRFQGLNQNNNTLNPLADFQEILLAQDPNDALKKSSRFLSLHDNSPMIIAVYQKRAQIFFQQKKDKQAISSLRTLIDKYPTLDVYEYAHKALGDYYMQKKNYKEAFESFSEAMKVSNTYSESLLKYFMLENLYFLAKEDKKYVEKFIELSQDTKILNKDQKKTIEEYQNDIIAQSNS